MWKARHDAFWAVRACWPGRTVLVTDVAVPISRLADCITETEQLDENTFLIHTGDSSIEYLVKVAVKNDWGLYKLLPHERTLEQIFVDLTTGDDEVPEESPFLLEDADEDIDAAYENAAYSIFEEESAEDDSDDDKRANNDKRKGPES